MTSTAAKTAGKAIANQLVESGANIATDALMGNNVNDSLQRELQAGRHNAVIGVQKLKNSLKKLETSEKKRKISNEYMEDEDDSQDSDHEVGDFVNHNRGRGRNKKQVKKSKKQKAKIYHLSGGRIMKWE